MLYFMTDSGKAGRWGKNGDRVFEGIVVDQWGWRVGYTVEKSSVGREKPGKTKLDQSMGTLNTVRYLYLMCRQWEAILRYKYVTKVVL